MIHIGVYAICKNEARHVFRWVSSIWNNGQGADKVYVLDTGSTDGTVDAIRDACIALCVPSDWLIVQTKQYSSWRFDAARNDNLAMTQADADWLDVLVCVDLDETIIPDFWPDLRSLLEDHPDFGRIWYLYAWSHDDTGTPKRVYWADKVHPTKGCHWIHAVHESLVEGANRNDTFYMPNDRIYVHHWPDFSKSRDSYLELLKVRANEEPNDIYGLYYLMRELLWRDPRSLDALSIANNAVIQIASQRAVDEYDCFPFFCGAIADIYAAWGLEDEAEHFYRRALAAGPNIRQPYISYGSWAAYHGRHELAMVLMDSMERHVPQRYSTWYECDYNWTWRPLQIKGVAACWAGDYSRALAIFKTAEEAYLKTDTDRKEAECNGFFTDKQWLHNYLKEKEDTRDGK